MSNERIVRTFWAALDAAGKIAAITEYWATDEEPPEWRRTDLSSLT